MLLIKVFIILIANDELYKENRNWKNKNPPKCPWNTRKGLQRIGRTGDQWRLCSGTILTPMGPFFPLPFFGLHFSQKKKFQNSSYTPSGIFKAYKKSYQKSYQKFLELLQWSYNRSYLFFWITKYKFGFFNFSLICVYCIVHK